MRATIGVTIAEILVPICAFCMAWLIVHGIFNGS